MSAKGKTQAVLTNGDGEFWTGQGWSSEYPNAQLFTSPDRARELGSRLRLGGETALIDLVLDYGLETETRVEL